ncbi:hydrolase [Caulobacter phage CcrPW]|uniref:Putative dehalogenase-hydrolase n=1 Tax=Caulobacter phage CcrPW TaxID=2283271 RepID=A0A385EAD0_9CAUD|nr:hydrolase [Caulobacter phage CcrPW]AXQ68814.1 putative dehalogenase-hydrolase [Caulobacter phage CcrPW]
MNDIKHISFDVWKTLIDPSPEFGVARRQLLIDTFDLPPAQVEAAYRKVKDSSDNEAESNGIGYTSAQVYENLMAALGLPSDDWWALRSKIEALFAQHPPIVRPGVAETLQTLQAAGYGLSISSNTNFVAGACLREVVLDHLGIEWSYTLFSDQMAIAKPNPLMWHAVKSLAALHSNAEPHQILHVGDNLICDGKCVDFGLKFHFINQPADFPALTGVLLNAQAA